MERLYEESFTLLQHIADRQFLEQRAEQRVLQRGHKVLVVFEDGFQHAHARLVLARLLVLHELLLRVDEGGETVRQRWIHLHFCGPALLPRAAESFLGVNPCLPGCLCGAAEGPRSTGPRPLAVGQGEENLGTDRLRKKTTVIMEEDIRSQGLFYAARRKTLWCGQGVYRKLVGASSGRDERISLRSDYLTS